MSEWLLYAVNFLLALLLIDSIAGSVLFVLVKKFADLCCRRYEVRYPYGLMRAVILFFLIPALFLSMALIRGGSNICREWWDPFGTGDLQWMVSIQDDFGILMLSNKKLNVARACIFCIWLAGFAIVFIRQLVRERDMVHKILEHSMEVDETYADGICGRLAGELGIKKKIRIYESSLIAAPFLAGILHPKIFFPKEKLCEEDFCSILKHEYVHCKRHDTAYRLAMMAIKGLYWYHPSIRLFARDFFNYSELACDEEALKDADADARYRYASLVLSMMEKEQGDVRDIYFAGFTSRGEAEVQKRMVRIMRAKQKSPRPVRLSGVVFFGLLCPVAIYGASKGVGLVGSHISEYAQVRASIEEGNYSGFYKVQRAHFEPGWQASSQTQAIRLERGVWEEVSIIVADVIEDFPPATLKKGDCIGFTLLSANRGEFFVGIKDKHGEGRYIYSIEGIVSYDLIIEETSDYTVFIGRDSKNGKKGTGKAGNAGKALALEEAGNTGKVLEDAGSVGKALGEAGNTGKVLEDAGSVGKALEDAGDTGDGMEVSGLIMLWK